MNIYNASITDHTVLVLGKFMTRVSLSHTCASCFSSIMFVSASLLTFSDIINQNSTGKLIIKKIGCIFGSFSGLYLYCSVTSFKLFYACCFVKYAYRKLLCPRMFQIRFIWSFIISKKYIWQLASVILYILVNI